VSSSYSEQHVPETHTYFDDIVRNNLQYAPQPRPPLLRKEPPPRSYSAVRAGGRGSGARPWRSGSSLGGSAPCRAATVPPLAAYRAVARLTRAAALAMFRGGGARGSRARSTRPRARSSNGARAAHATATATAPAAEGAAGAEEGGRVSPADTGSCIIIGKRVPCGLGNT
jgi:hypothetical protein